MIRLCIADDHPIVREGLKHVVSQCSDIQVVGEAEDAERAIEIVGEVPVDVLLLDVSMPGPGVLATIRRLKSLQATLRILVLSVHPEEHYGKRVLKAGADGYLTKDYTAEALASAIRQVHKGQKYVSAGLAQELALDLSRDRGERPHETLSNREYEVFVLLGSGKRAPQVAQQLNLSPKTVRTYRARILQKMHLAGTTELIFYALRSGLVPEGIPDDPSAAPEIKATQTLEKQGRRSKTQS
jgi:two-component system invasion response regulator UvrY